MSWVAIYGNYFVLMYGCQMLVDALSRGLNAGVGDLVAEGEIKSIKVVFWEIVTARLFIAGLVCTGIILLSESFVNLWIGEQYLLPQSALFVMTAIFFIQMTRTADIFLYAYGLFQDIWAPFIESFLNVFLSILFGYLWGLTGILVGVMISQLIVVFCWKSYFLYKQGFKQTINEYVVLYSKKVSLLIITSVVSLHLFELIYINVSIDIIEWILRAALFMVIYTSVGFICFTVFDFSFRSLIRRVMMYFQ